MQVGSDSQVKEGEITHYVKSLLAGEVPRLILKEYEQSRQSNSSLSERIESLKADNDKLKEQLKQKDSDLT